MKKIIAIFLCLAVIPAPQFVLAQTLRQDRRIEEEKRESLKGTLEDMSDTDRARLTPSENFDIEYFEQLYVNKVAFRYDACKTVIILLGLEKQYGDIDSQIAFFIKNDILPKEHNVNFDASKPLRKGEAAYMFCRALRLRGGLWIRMFGLSQRYALKELVYEGIMFPGATNEIVSGKELILMLTESARYITSEITKEAHLKYKKEISYNEI